jgi:hypothetical protein
MSDILALEFTYNPQRPRHPRVPRTPHYTGLIMSAVLGLSGAACKPKTHPVKLATQSSAASGQTSATGAAPWTQPPRRSFVKPEGPAFAIMAGEGLGPVRFGANVATVERLMDSKCEELTEKYCRYIAAGIEYELENGVVSGIVVYRHDRPVVGSSGKSWGRTRCAIMPDLTPRVVVNYVHANLGNPQSSETIDEANPNRTALREHYQGLVLEFDRGEYTRELVLGSIRILKLDNPPKPKPVVAQKGSPEPLH